jgi:TRAP-type C4-dicarboxylate transport system permease small subunit
MIEIIEIAHAGVITDAPTFSAIGQKILFFLLSLVGVIAIIMIVISGMKYLLAFGDPKQLESAKKSVRAWIIGLVIAFGSLVIIRAIGQFFS